MIRSVVKHVICSLKCALFFRKRKMKIKIFPGRKGEYFHATEDIENLMQAWLRRIVATNKKLCYTLYTEFLLRNNLMITTWDMSGFEFNVNVFRSLNIGATKPPPAFLAFSHTAWLHCE
jgi:hypothetical protein